MLPPKRPPEDEEGAEVFGLPKRPPEVLPVLVLEEPNNPPPAPEVLPAPVFWLLLPKRPPPPPLGAAGLPKSPPLVFPVVLEEPPPKRPPEVLPVFDCCWLDAVFEPPKSPPPVPPVFDEAPPKRPPPAGLFWPKRFSVDCEPWLALLLEPKRPPDGAAEPEEALFWPPNPPNPPDPPVFPALPGLLLLEPNRNPDPELTLPVDAREPKAGFCWEVPKRPEPPEEEAPNIEVI